MNNEPNQQNPYQQNPNQGSYNPNQPLYTPNEFNQSQYNSGQQPGQQYPPQGFMPPQPPQKVKHARRNLGIGCGVLVVALALCGIITVTTNKGSNTGTVVGGSTVTSSQPTTSPTKAPASTHFILGQVVKTGSWQVTVNSVKTSTGSQYVKPTKGQFLLLDVSVINTSSTEQSISSLLNFKLMDSTGISYTETFSGSDAPNPPDGKVEAESPSRGTFTYDVPTSIKAFTFVFEPDITADGESIWDIKP